MQCQFLTIEVYLIFRLIILTADVYFTHTFYIQQFLFQFGRDFIRSSKIITIYFKVGTGLGTHTTGTTTQNYLCLIQLGIGLQVFTHLITDRFQLDFTVTRTHQTDVKADNMATIVLHGSESIVRISLSHRIVTNLHHTFVTLHPLFRQFRSQCLRTLYTSTYGKLQIHTDTTIISRREELRTNIFGTEQTCHKESGTTNHDSYTMAYSPIQTVLIPHIECIERTLNRFIESNEPLTLLLLQTQELRTHHRCK